jgi:lipopolysaccharide transport system ATP-binding protein
MRPAIRVDKLSKQYQLGQTRRPNRQMRELLTDSFNSMWGRLWGRRSGRLEPSGPANGSFWALRDVSFEIQPGEVVGVIGRNGAGKSTLLKILSRIVEPTSGRAEVRGRMGSLLEVGTGFHPELTGRENIFLNGSILGMTRTEISQKFDEIVAFSGIEQFLDTPVKRYSSGMYVRLAFAVAAHLEPDILVVDEVLAVGDAQFQDRCINRMRKVSDAGRTVLFVSHNLPAIQNLSSRCFLIQDGEIDCEGTPEEVIARYNAQLSGQGCAEVPLTFHPGRRVGSVPTMTRATLSDQSGLPSARALMGTDLRITVDFESAEFLDNITYGLVVKNQYSAPIFGVNNLVIPSPPLPHPVRLGSIHCTLPKLPLMPGRYMVDFYFGSHGHNFDVIYNAVEFEVDPKDVFQSGRLPPTLAGDVFWPATWEFTTDG